jgi:outer membrane protein TolC
VARNRKFTTICAVAVMALAGLAAAEEGLTVATAPGQQQRGVSFGAAELRLTLQEAVTLALEHNINLEVSRLSLARANEGIFAAAGIFDPYVSAAGDTSYSSSPSTNQLQGATVSESRRRTFDLSFGTLLPTGTQAALTWTNARSETNSTFYYLNPNYNSTLGLTITQPLLQGFGTDVNRNGIEVARKSGEISRLQFEEIVIATVQQVENAYWDLVYAIENLKVKEQSLALARDLLDQTRTRVRIGTSAPIDIVQSEATVAAREQDIIVAEHAVLEAQDVLKGLMGFETLQDWASRIVPVNSLQVDRTPVALEEAVAAAFARRTELKQDEIQRQIARMNLVVAENNVRPQLDLVLGYGLQGVGGTLEYTDPVTGNPVTVPGGWDDALEMLRDADYDQWTAAVNLRYPLGNTQAKAQRVQARYSLRSAEQVVAAQRQTVIQQVRRAVRAIESSGKSIDAAVKARELAERNLDAEQKKFANGMSTNYQVLKIQEDLAMAQAAELNARVVYRRSVVGYNVATGTLLDVMGVALRGEEAREEPHTLWKDVKWLQFGHWADVDEKEGAGDGAEDQAEKAPAPAKEQGQ